MRTLANDQNGNERRAPQREWLVHGIQVGAILVTIGLTLGVPLLFWANAVNTGMATMVADQKAMVSRIDRQERDLSDQRQTQIIFTNQVIEVNKGLTRLDANLDNIRSTRK